MAAHGLRPVCGLGSGANSRVSLAVDMDQGGFYALKTVPKARASLRPAAALNERAILASVGATCPFVPRLERTAKDAANLYFVLELASGGALHKHFRGAEGGRLPEARARFYAAEVTAALDALHGAGWAHRDVKASNVVLTRAGHVRLVDLGLAARIVSDRPDSAEPRRARTFLGTPHCMAPEVLALEGVPEAERGDGYEAELADWWALGVLVFEMATGAPPFGYRGDIAARARQGAAAVDFSALAGAPLMEAFVRALLNPDPAERLGAGGGGEVFGHEWFADLDWDALRAEALPPPEPHDDELDVLREFESSSGGAGGGPPLTEEDQAEFLGF